MYLLPAVVHFRHCLVRVPCLLVALSFSSLMCVLCCCCLLLYLRLQVVYVDISGALCGLLHHLSRTCVTVFHCAILCFALTCCLMLLLLLCGAVFTMYFAYYCYRVGKLLRQIIASVNNTSTGSAISSEVPGPATQHTPPQPQTHTLTLAQTPPTPQTATLSVAAAVAGGAGAGQSPSAAFLGPASAASKLPQEPSRSSPGPQLAAAATITTVHPVPGHSSPALPLGTMSGSAAWSPLPDSRQSQYISNPQARRNSTAAHSPTVVLLSKIHRMAVWSTIACACLLVFLIADSAAFLGHHATATLGLLLGIQTCENVRMRLPLLFLLCCCCAFLMIVYFVCAGVVFGRDYHLHAKDQPIASAVCFLWLRLCTKPRASAR